MDQEPLYQAIQNCGFSVMEFHDHPAAFGSWWVAVRRGRNSFRIVFDGRDSFLSIEKEDGSARWLPVVSQMVEGGDEDAVKLAQQWLTKNKNTGL